MSQKICFIGAGNMATSLIGGLITNQYPATLISACDINQDALTRLVVRYGINAGDTDFKGVAEADIIILAVKPQVMAKVCAQLSGSSNNAEQLFVSIAAGVPIDAIEKWLGGARSIVRCMPNTPALLQLGATALFANSRVTPGQKEAAFQIMRAVGVSLWVENESELDAVTAVSGSGPAYFFYFIELLEAAGMKLGLPPATAAILARQTALGAATMASDSDVIDLRARVTSKNGTTEQAILSFQDNNLGRLVDEATAAAHRRSLELANELTRNTK